MGGKRNISRCSVLSRSPSVDSTALNIVDHFCYLSSMLSSDASLDAEINSCYPKPALLSVTSNTDSGSIMESGNRQRSAFTMHLFLASCYMEPKPGPHTDTISRLLTTSISRRLRQIAHIKWEDKIPNTEVLGLCHIDSIKAFVMRCHLLWSEHIVGMDGHRLLKAVFYGLLRSEGANSKPWACKVENLYGLFCNFNPKDTE